MAESYHEELRKKNTLKLRERLKLLPNFMPDFFRGIAETTSARTRIGYAYDLKIFFQFLIEQRPLFANKTITNLTIEDLAAVTAGDIEMFMEFLTLYIKMDSNLELQNEEHGKSRKLSAIRTMFSFFYKRGMIRANPSELVDFPKLHEKAITRLEIDEVAKLLDMVESGEELTNGQQKYHKYTKKRDFAIVTLLLGTGMRVSECVGIDINHIDFDNSGIKVTRKGGNEAILFFGEEVYDALDIYLEERLNINALPGHEEALFLSMQNRRLTDRAIQNLVKKYAKLVNKLKNISPHKLRSTFGTSLYRETGDIYLVADVLGHSDVNTTRKHYAEMDEARRRKAAKHVKLRAD